MDEPRQVYLSGTLELYSFISTM